MGRAGLVTNGRVSRIDLCHTNRRPETGQAGPFGGRERSTMATEGHKEPRAILGREREKKRHS